MRGIRPHCKFSCQTLVLMITSALLGADTPVKHSAWEHKSSRGLMGNLTTPYIYVMYVCPNYSDLNSERLHFFFPLSLSLF